MSKLERDIDHAKNKLSGEAKEAAGKITGNEQLELKGKLQSSKADLKKSINNVADSIEDVKENIAKNTNNMIDESKKKQK
jgi:uncharacterized protein YjbJ (UPF0337 family)